MALTEFSFSFTPRQSKLFQATDTPIEIEATVHHTSRDLLHEGNAANFEFVLYLHNSEDWNDGKQGLSLWVRDGGRRYACSETNGHAPGR